MMFSTDPPATLHEETNIGKNRVTLAECLAVPWTAEGHPTRLSLEIRALFLWIHIW